MDVLFYGSYLKYGSDYYNDREEEGCMMLDGLANYSSWKIRGRGEEGRIRRKEKKSQEGKK